MSVGIVIIAHGVTTYKGCDGSITLQTDHEELPTIFEWEKLNLTTGLYEHFSSEKNLINLESGSYKVTATDSSLPICPVHAGPVGVLEQMPPQSSGMYIIIGANGVRTIVDCTTEGINVTIPAGKMIPIPQNLFTSAKLYMNGSLIETFDEPFEAWILSQS